MKTLHKKQTKIISPEKIYHNQFSATL